MASPENLSEVLKDSTRPAFLFGSTPPRDGTSEEKAREACAKFAARSAVLATDGFIVYDIQDEAGRTDLERPFPFRKTMDASTYASYFPPVSGKQCVVYKCVVEESLENFGKWLDLACDGYGHNAFTLVGAPTSSRTYTGPGLTEASALMKKRGGCDFGCVCIAERHTKKGNEDQNMLRKTRAGAEWFITQGIFDAKPLVRLINDYGSACKKEGVVPKKIILTFAPCGRDKTMAFIKWLGMNVPPEVEKRILEAANPVMESVVILQDLLVSILQGTAGCGVPLGLNVESLSIFKDEIEASHLLFQTLQGSLLNSRGSPWSVRWFCVRRALSYKCSQASEESLLLMEPTRHGASAAAAAAAISSSTSTETETETALVSASASVTETRDGGTRGELIFNSSGFSLFDQAKDLRWTSGTVSTSVWCLTVVAALCGGVAVGYSAAGKRSPA